MSSAASLPPLSAKKAALYILGATLCFHLAYLTPFKLLIFGYVICLTQLARIATARFAFYAALLTGLLCYGPQLGFFFSIFGPFAVLLWTVLAFWVALFVTLTHGVYRRVPAPWAGLLIPFLWTGLEYFRSEVYYLKFSWLNVGYALTGSWTAVMFRTLGVYATGFWAVLLAVSLLERTYKSALATAVFAAGLCALGVSGNNASDERSLRVAGVQMEFPSTDHLLAGLDALTAAHPDAELLVVSEYTLDGPVPDKVKNWCREHARYLVIGGQDPAPKSAYYDTAFVVGPTGEIVFKQGKSVPIQFFSDGLPATEQKLWDSPWGKLGICICYDLSYRRVTDRLVNMGAQALIVPTMDVAQWGRHEHLLHQRVAPARAAEYGIPIFRVASSGISQAVDATGHELATAPFLGEDAMLSARLTIGRAGRVPLDGWLAPLSVAVTAGCVAFLAFVGIRQRFRPRPRAS